MIINKITIERTFNLGNYQSEKLGMEVAYSDEDAPSDFVAEVRKLRAMVLEAASGSSAQPSVSRQQSVPEHMSPPEEADYYGTPEAVPSTPPAPQPDKDFGPPSGMYVYKIPFSMKQAFKDDAWNQKAKAKWDGDRKCWACVSEVKGWQEYRQ